MIYLGPKCIHFYGRKIPTLDFYDGFHMSSLLLHAKVEVDTVGYGICSSRSMSPIPEWLKLLYSKIDMLLLLVLCV